MEVRRVRTMCRPAPGIRTYIQVALTAVLFAVMGPARLFPQSVAVHQAWSADLRWCAYCLEDLSKQGTLLLRSSANEKPPIPKLMLRSTDQPAKTEGIPLEDFLKFAHKLPREIRELVEPGPFRFVGEGDRIVGAQGPWLALIDVGNKREVRRVLAVKDFAELVSKPVRVPGFKRDPATGKVEPDPAGPGLLQYSAPPPPIVAASPDGEAIAIAYNERDEQEIIIFSSDLTRETARWKVPRKVQDLCWSPGGKPLLVLYYNDAYSSYSPQGKYVGWHADPALASVPDVALFNPGTGAKAGEFVSGGYQARAVFSPDGALVYMVPMTTGVEGRWEWAEEEIRVFSTADWKLVRTIKVAKAGARNNLAVSPDGRFIAVETSKNIDHWISLDNGRPDVELGFALLDSATGRVLFREDHHRALGGIGVLPLIFSRDGKLLVANFADSGGWGDTAGSRVVAYSMPP